jgi:hypothetical protein
MKNKGDILQYFRTALAVTTTRQSGLDTIIAMLDERRTSTEVLISANISVRDALRTQGNEAKRVILKELKQMLVRDVFRPVHRSLLKEQERRSTIRSSMFLKAKYHPDGTFDKLKARLVEGISKTSHCMLTYHRPQCPQAQSSPWQRWRRMSNAI